jgi:hypothetical protein
MGTKALAEYNYHYHYYDYYYRCLIQKQQTLIDILSLNINNFIQATLDFFYLQKWLPENTLVQSTGKTFKRLIGR